jgi:penicillin-insensitive murein endopeptidase
VLALFALFHLCLFHACGAPHTPAGEPIDADAATPSPQPSQPPTPQEPPQKTPEEREAHEQRREIEALLALGPEATASIGSPADGQLRGGVALPLRGPGFRFQPGKNGRHGAVELVTALLRAAAAVEAAHPGGLATIGELSLPEGGPIAGHGSHQAGRDVDVLFYLLGADGAPIPSKAIPLDPAGQGADYGDLLDPTDDQPVRIDLVRTWAFVEALLQAAGDDLQRIFVVEHIRGLLLAEAERAGAAPELRERFAAVTCQPGFPHDDHLHIRFFCAADDIAAGCTELDPIYPWQHERLAALGLAPVKAAARRAAARPKLTTHEEARAKAGPMHQDVIDFLDRRRAWIRQPHPRRPYCR